MAYFALRHSAFPSIVITLATRLFVLPAEHSENLTYLHISRHVTILSVTFCVSCSRTDTNTNKQYLWNTKGTNDIKAASVSHRLSGTTRCDCTVIGHADCTHKHSSSSVICQTTGPKPLPKRFLHIVRSRASSFN